jgi:hypothetical protein
MCFSTGECPMAIIIKLDVESVGLHPEELMREISIIVLGFGIFLVLKK